MGSLFTTTRSSDTPLINRYPILTPKHVPTGHAIPANYAVFDKNNFIDKFKYPAKEPPKYW